MKAGSPPRSQDWRAAQAALVAMPVALLALALVESLWALQAGAASVPALVALAALVVRHAPLHVMGVMLFQVAVVLTLLLPPRSTRLKAAACVVLAAAATVSVYNTFAAYEPFARYVPLLAALAILLVMLLVLLLQLAGSSLLPGSATVRRAAWWALPFSCLVGFAGLHALNHVVQPGLYPTFHLGLLQVALLLLHLGCALLLARLRRVPVAIGIASALGVAACLVAVRAEWTQSSRGRFLAETLVGQSEGRRQLELALEPAGERKVFDDPQAIERFQRHDGLPDLPEDLELDDYNILLITSEATRFDQTSLHDEARGTTPQLLSFQRAGAFTFTRAYAPSSGTLSSMSSIFGMSHFMSGVDTLFDHASDPTQQRDVHSLRPDLARDLDERMSAFLRVREASRRYRVNVARPRPPAGD